MGDRNWSRVRARRLLDKLRHEHGFSDHIILSESRKMTWCLGRAFYTTPRKIKLSSHLTDNELDDTLRHEFAHILTGPNHGHDKLWKQMAIMVGARPIRCAAAPMELAPKKAQTHYEIVCVRCDQFYTLKRYQPKRYIYRCPQCRHVVGAEDPILRLNDADGYQRIQ